MAFERRTWYQRLGQGLNKFLIGEKDAEGKQELTNAPDSITQQGDVISADNLNDLEGRIQAGFNELFNVELAWENPLPSQDFAGQTITTTETGRNWLIAYRPQSGSNIILHKLVCLETANEGTFHLSYTRVDTQIFFYDRAVTIDPDGTFTFAEGRRVTQNLSEYPDGNSGCIPLYIYKVINMYGEV